jgi:hypothetical protein
MTFNENFCCILLENPLKCLLTAGGIICKRCGATKGCDQNALDLLIAEF